MSLFITKVISSNTRFSFNYFESEHLWSYTFVGDYTFNILDVLYRDGDDILFEGIDALKQVYLKNNIVGKIGLDEFRNGRIINFSLPESSHVKSTEASLSIEEEVLVDSDSVLSDLIAQIPSPQFVESFSESFSSSRSNNSFSQNREVSLKYKKGISDQFLSQAHLFLKGIYLNSRPSYGFQEDGISENLRFDVLLKPLISETYDILNKEIRLSESIESSRVSQTEDILFSERSTHSLSLGDDGFTTKRYNVEVKALSEPLEVNIISGVHFVLDSLFTGNSGEFGHPFSIQKNIRSDGGEASLSIEFSNDPRKNSINNIDYSASKSKDGSFDGYSFSIDISSRGVNRIAAFDFSKEYWNQNYNIALEKIPYLFPEISSGELFEKSRSVNFRPFERKISENINYTTDPSYGVFDDGILKRTIQVNDTFGVDRHSISPILGDKEILFERGAGKTLSSRSVNVDLVGLSNENLEEQALSYATGEIPQASYYYLDEKNSSFDPLNNSFSASINYLYFD